MRHWYKLLQFSLGVSLADCVLAGVAIAQREMPNVDLIQDQVVLGLPGNRGLDDAAAKKMLFTQMRGLLQNELTVVSGVCDLSPEQRQSLADVAEMEWKAKTNASVSKRTQQHVYGMIDLDGLAERSVHGWLEAVGNQAHLAKYDEELADRMKWRKQAVISRMLDVLSTKLNLSGIQMQQIEAVLEEKWKDRWYRSIEGTFDNGAIQPDIRPSWISPFLSEAQRAASATREVQTVFERTATRPDLPAQSLEERFTVGDATSARTIELGLEPRKSISVEEVIKRAGKAAGGELEGDNNETKP